MGHCNLSNVVRLQKPWWSVAPITPTKNLPDSGAIYFKLRCVSKELTAKKYKELFRNCAGIPDIFLNNGPSSVAFVLRCDAKTEWKTVLSRLLHQNYAQTLSTSSNNSPVVSTIDVHYIFVFK